METVNVHCAEPTFGMQVGQIDLRIHDASRCEGQHCPFHNPSEHKMKFWEMNVRLDNKALVERMCRHGVGHPDPDSLAYFESKGISYMGVHGCDGCCYD